MSGITTHILVDEVSCLRGACTHDAKRGSSTTLNYTTCVFVPRSPMFFANTSLVCSRIRQVTDKRLALLGSSCFVARRQVSASLSTASKGSAGERSVTGPQTQSVCNWFCPDLERKYVDGARFYEVDGGDGKMKLLPSVTSVLNMVNKPGLNYWAVNITLKALENIYSEMSEQRNDKLVVMGKTEMQKTLQRSKNTQKDFLQAAADLGTRTHDTIDRIIRGDTDGLVVDEDCRQGVKNFWDWWSTSGFVLDPRGDSMVYSLKYGFAGAADAIGLNDQGDLVVLDFKTSGAVYDTHGIQAAAYAKALEEQLIGNGVLPEQARVKEAYIVRIEKHKPGYEVKRVNNIDESFNAFKAALYLWHYDRGDKMTRTHYK